MTDFFSAAWRAVRRLGLGAGIGLGASGLGSAAAWAQGGDPAAFTQTTGGDWALGFVDFLFNGGTASAAAPFAGGSLATLAAAMRGAMGAYSVAMLVVAGFLLFYHVAAMVAETAHHGVVMGRRANQVWAPVRLLVAVMLLVPVSGGLSAGQYVVLKIAASGSNLASRAWGEVAQSFSGTFFNLVSPRPPDLSRFALASVEMEMCRAIYERLRVQQQADVAMRLAGAMNDVQKRVATTFAPETWRYSNLLGHATPMCGEYRFTGYRLRGGDRSAINGGLAVLSNDVAAFAQQQAASAVAQARSVALLAAPAFAGAETAAMPSARESVALIRQTVQKQMEAQIRALAAAQSSLAVKYGARASEAGWVSAAFLIPDLMRLQAGYGELVAFALPQVQEPVFAHRTLAQKALAEALALEPSLRAAERDSVMDALAHFYGNVSMAVGRVRTWLYDSQNDAAGAVAYGGFDILDNIGVGTDAPSAFALLARAVDTTAISQGVWGDAAGTQDVGNPFSWASVTEAQNPLEVLGEFGRRQMAFGGAVAGMASGLLSTPQAVAPAILVMLLGGVFLLGGGALLFVVPLVPFVRLMVGILVWLVEVLESLVAVPLVALAHLTPSGEGLSGSAARQAYLLWIALAIRPVLSIFGFVAGVLIFAVGVFALMVAFAPVSALANVANGGMMVVANTALVLVYDALACLVAWVAFRGITVLPSQALRWISSFVMTDGASVQEAAPATAQASVALSAPQTMGAIGSRSFSSQSSTTHQAGGRAASRETPAGGRMGYSALFPVSRHESDRGGADKDKGARGAALAPASKEAGASLAASVSVAAEIKDRRIEPKAKKKDKEDAKDDPFAQAPFLATQDKREGLQDGIGDKEEDAGPEKESP